MSTLHPRTYAWRTPSKVALRMASSGVELTYAQLDRQSNQSARMLRGCGLRRGDVVAFLFNNAPEVFILGWAAQRAGLFATSVSTKLTPGEISYILRDSGAKLLVVSDGLAKLAEQALAENSALPAFAWSTSSARLENWSLIAGDLSSDPIPDESPGTDLLYSSGTTGRPKGVAPVLPTHDEIGAPTPLTAMGELLYAMGPETLYLSTSPLYHAAPQRWAMTVQRLGGTVVVMDRFEPEQVLALIQAQAITHATFVPTHFVRMLKLPVSERLKYDISSLTVAIHAAAPCPVPIKQAMIDWWGPILFEYYSGTESCGITALSSEEWLKKPGSVGRAVVGTLRIVGEAGDEVGPGIDGEVYFSDGPAFSYLNDPVKTAEAHNDKGWATLGDIGHVDEDGYLFLTDRKSFTIISGGVNIYPQEVENLLVTHPKILDAAVFGVPDPEMGETVIAVLQPVSWRDATESFAEELDGWMRARLSSIKIPRRIEFMADLPRDQTGKLYKRLLRQQFAEAPNLASA